MNEQGKIEILKECLESLEAAADATRQRIEQLEAQQRPWPSVREAEEAIRERYQPAGLSFVEVFGVAQDSDGDVYAYGLARNTNKYIEVYAIIGRRANHPAGWENSWTPAHEMRQDDHKPTRYPWHEAPEWARFAATDEDGSMWWYHRRPTSDATSRAWSSSRGLTHRFEVGAYRYNVRAAPCPDWLNSLEARP